MTAADDVTDFNNEVVAEASKVAMFPSGYFDSGYSENYAIAGVDENNRQYSGTYQVITGDVEIFNGINAIPVASTLTYTTMINGVQVKPVTITLTEYFSFSQPKQYLGSINSNTSLIFTLQDAAIDIPTTSYADTSGPMASLAGSNSSIEVIDWSVLSNEDDTYDISYTYNNSDSAGGLIDFEVRVFTVDNAGERMSWSLVAELPALNNTLSFSGARL